MPDLRALTARALPPARALATASLTAAMLGRVEAILAFTPESERAALFDRHLQKWAARTLRILGIALHEATPRPPPARGARLVVSAHRAATDIFIAQALFGGRILSRADLAKWPVIGKLAGRTGTIFVERDSKESGASAIRQIRRHLQAGDTITVFPEGTTHRGDEVQEFKAGVFAALSRLEVEIVPVGIAYPEGVEYWHESFVAHIERLAGRVRTDVGVAIGTPRMAKGRPGELAATLHDEVQELTHAARRALEAR